MKHEAPPGQFEVIGRLVWPNWPALIVARHQPTGELRLVEEVAAASVPNLAARLATDAMRAAQLSDRHLLRLHDWATTDDRQRAILVWELPEAERLDDYLQRAVLDPDAGIEISRQLLRALSALHRGGLVHGRVADHFVLLLRDHGALSVKLAGLSLGRLPRLAARGSAFHQAAAVNDVSAIARLALGLGGAILPASVRSDLERAAAPVDGERVTVADLLFSLEAALPARGARPPAVPKVLPSVRWRPLLPADHLRLAELLGLLFPERSRPPAADPLALEAWALIEAGDWDEARRCIDLILQRDPFHKLAHKLRQRLLARSPRAAASDSQANNTRVCADIDELVRQNRLREALVELEAWTGSHGEDDELASLRSYLEHRIAEARRESVARGSRASHSSDHSAAPERQQAAAPLERAPRGKRAGGAAAAPAPASAPAPAPPPPVESPAQKTTQQAPPRERAPRNDVAPAPVNRLAERVADNLRHLLQQDRVEEAARGLQAATSQFGEDPSFDAVRTEVRHRQEREDVLRSHKGRLLLRLTTQGLDETLSELERVVRIAGASEAWQREVENELRREAAQGQAIEQARAGIKESLGTGELAAAERTLAEAKQRYGSAPFLTLEQEVATLADRARRHAAAHLINEGKAALASGKTWTAIRAFERATTLLPSESEPWRLLRAANDQARSDPAFRKRVERLAQARRRLEQLLERGRWDRAQRLLEATATELDAAEELRDLRLRIERRGVPARSKRSMARWLISRR